MTGVLPDPFYVDDRVTVYAGDALDVLAGLPDCSVDSVVTDPPYGLEFMGKEWDTYKDRDVTADGRSRQSDKWGSVEGAGAYSATLPRFTGKQGASLKPYQDWCQLWATQCLRVLKPGGHLLAFGGTRTAHRLTCAIEDAGFEIRDSIAWLYGSGFPKSLDVSKAIDKRGGNAHLAADIAAAIRTARESRGWTTGQADRHFCGGTTNWTWYEGRKGLCRPPTPADFARIVAEWPELAPLADAVAEADREVVGQAHRKNDRDATSIQLGRVADDYDVTAPATVDATRWQGWGTALKPAHEPITVARKPLGGSLNVRVCVERSLRDQGHSGDITWTTEPASAAAPSSPTTGSGTTPPQPTAATSAKTANASVTAPTAKPTATCTAKLADDGANSTLNVPVNSADKPTSDSATPSSPPTAPTAPAAVNNSGSSSPSTISTEAAPLTANQSTARSTDNSDGLGSLRVTASFAGTATGLIGSQAHVRIDRLSDGRFVWPGGLPLVVTAGSTVAGNVLAWGTGALNVDACRIGTGTGEPAPEYVPNGRNQVYGDGMGGGAWAPTAGRWPPNVALDTTQAATLDQQTGPLHSQDPATRNGGQRPSWSPSGSARGAVEKPNASGGVHEVGTGASRFMYVAKADTNERIRHDLTAHPTVKPLDLMRWLVRLVTPPSGTCLDPFAGSGTTAEAALLEGFRAIVIEREPDYLPLITQRIHRRRDPVAYIKAAGGDMGLFGLEGQEEPA